MLKETPYPLKGVAENVLKILLWNIGEEIKEKIGNVDISSKNSIRICFRRQWITNLVHVLWREQSIRAANLGENIIRKVPTKTVYIPSYRVLGELACIAL